MIGRMDARCDAADDALADRRGHAPPRARRMSFQGVFHDPNALRRELLWENLVPALASPGYLDAFVNLTGYDIRDRLGTSRTRR